MGLFDLFRRKHREREQEQEHGGMQTISGLSDEGQEYGSNQMMRGVGIREAGEETAATFEMQAGSQLADYTQQQASQREQANALTGFVLLGEGGVNWRAVRLELSNRWGIQTTEQPDGENWLFQTEQLTVALAYMPAAIPGGEVEESCRYNVTWPQAERTVSAHRSHIIVSVRGGSDPVQAHMLFTKVTAGLLAQDNALGFYMQPMVVEPRTYIRSAEMLTDNELPVHLWVFVGLYTSERGVGSYTYGLDKFGKDELEVLGSSRSKADVYEFVTQIAAYLVTYDAVLRDGETLDLTETEKLTLTRSPGVAAQGDSIKIGY